MERRLLVSVILQLFQCGFGTYTDNIEGVGQDCVTLYQQKHERHSLVYQLVTHTHIRYKLCFRKCVPSSTRALIFRFL